MEAEPRSRWWYGAHSLVIAVSFTTAVMALLLSLDPNRSTEFQRAVLGLSVATLGLLFLYACCELWRHWRAKPQ